MVAVRSRRAEPLAPSTHQGSRGRGSDRAPRVGVLTPKFGSDKEGIYSKTRKSKRNRQFDLACKLEYTRIRDCNVFVWDFVDIARGSSMRIIGAHGGQIHPRDGIRPIGNKYFLIWFAFGRTTNKYKEERVQLNTFKKRKYFNIVWPGYYSRK
jgi:hypothetical protein